MPNIIGKYKYKIRKQQRDADRHINQPLVVSRPAFLGDNSGNITTYAGEELPPGYVVIRDTDGNLSVAFNQKVPLTPNLAITVGYDPILNPALFQVLGLRDFLSLSTASAVPNHNKTHEWPGNDTVFVRSEQYLPGLLFANNGFTVSVFPFFFKKVDGTYGYQPYETIDLTSYVPTTGAQAIVLAAGDDGVMHVILGNAAASIGVLSLADFIYAPDNSMHVIWGVRLYYGQSTIQQTLVMNDTYDFRHSGMSTSYPGPIQSNEDTFRFGVGGALAVVQDVDSPLIVSNHVNRYRWMVRLKNTGLSGTSTFDINKNGASVFSNASDRPSIAFDDPDGVAISGVATTIAFVTGDIISLDIDEVAQGASDLSVVALTTIPVVITATSGLFKYDGDADPVFTYASSISGLVFSGALSRVAGEAGGLYAITQGTLEAPVGYEIVFVSADFAIAATLTPSSASVVDTWAGSAANLIDFNDSTYWESTTWRNGSPWFKVDLGASKVIARIRAFQDATSWAATIVRIETSPDDSVWTTQYTSPAAVVAEHIATLPFISARYIRVTCTSGGSGSGWRVFSCDVKGY